MGERLAARVGPESLEGGQQGRGLVGADGPLDAASDTRRAEVVAAHERRRDRAVGGGEEVGLRVEAGRRIVEHPGGDCLRPHLGQVEQPSQGIGVGDGEVVRGQHPDPGTPVQGIQQATVDLFEPGLHDEADQQVHAVEPRIAQAPQQVIAQQPILPVDQCIWFRHGRQVVALARDDMPHAAARVRHITAVTRDDVDMQVSDSLPGGRAGVEADVIAVGLQLGVEPTLDLVDESEDVRPLIVSSLPPGSDHASRHHEGMSRADREAIGNDERGMVRCEPLRSRDRQEWRVTVGHLGSHIGLRVDGHHTPSANDIGAGGLSTVRRRWAIVMARPRTWAIGDTTHPGVRSSDAARAAM